MRLVILGGAAAAVVVAAAAYHLASGQRYKLHVDADAARCWTAIQVVTFAPSATHFRRIDGPHRQRDGLIETHIHFTTSNVFAGSRDFRGTCVFDSRDASGGTLAVRLLIDGHELEAEVLEAVNAALAAE